MPMQKFNEIGWSFHSQGIDFETSNLTSVYNKDDAGNDLGFATLTCWNDLAMTTQSADQTDATLNCVKTVVDWEPTFDYEIVQGKFHQELDPGIDMYIYVIGVPDVPVESGGSKPFVCCLNLDRLPLKDGFTADGRRPKRLNYNATYHTNKMRLIINHPAGTKHKCMIVYEVYKA